MQSIYWVLTWACHRKCKHCYDDRFRPYIRDALTEVVDEGQRAYEAVIKNLPDDMTWMNPATGARERTLIIMAGGELLIDGVREELFYPALDAIKARWGENGPRLAVQTTGDILTDQILGDLLSKGVTSISISSIDDYHVGMKGEKKFAFMAEIRAMMDRHGVREVSIGGAKSERLEIPDSGPTKSGKLDRKDGPTFLFFGAQEDLWIGELWPRGRAWTNGLSNATYETNFCTRWSGGKNFLNIHESGSEIAIEPDGSIYPCCIKTKTPLGSLAEERLVDILDSVRTLPEIRALNDGDPEKMGEALGWSRDTFREKAAAVDGKGRTVSNVCLGCDKVFALHLSEKLQAMRSERIAKKTALTRCESKCGE